MNWNNLIQCAYGSKLPCRAYSVHYAHEDYSDYVPFIEQDKYPSMNFNNNEGIKSVKIGASLNNYDIVKELGEENIKYGMYIFTEFFWDKIKKVTNLIKF